jgi:hypothetical protein
VTSFQLRTGAPGTRILAFGHYQPSNVVTNDDIAKSVETNDEWIQSRVGIKQRRIAGPDESVVDMAVQAGGKALANSGLSTSTWSSSPPARRRRRSRTPPHRWPPGSASCHPARTT